MANEEMSCSVDAPTGVHELSVERRIAAPPATVWRAMTEHVAEWWCPRPWRTEVHAIEWRAGGVFHLTMHGPDGEKADEPPGVLLEVVPERRLVFTDAFGPGWVPQGPFMVGIFELTPDGEGTHYRASARHWSEKARDDHAAMGFTDGWGAVADQLAALAEGLK